MIRIFGLSDNVLADDEVERLSGGDRQSVKIGRTIAFWNRVAIMDEPTNPLSLRQHVDELAVRRKDQGPPVICITREILQVHEPADRVAILENGEVIEDPAMSSMTAEALEEEIRHRGRVSTVADRGDRGGHRALVDPVRPGRHGGCAREGSWGFPASSSWPRHAATGHCPDRL